MPFYDDVVRIKSSSLTLLFQPCYHQLGQTPKVLSMPSHLAITSVFCLMDNDDSLDLNALQHNDLVPNQIMQFANCTQSCTAAMHSFCTLLPRLSRNTIDSTLLHISEAQQLLPYKVAMFQTSNLSPTFEHSLIDLHFMP